MYGSLPTDRRMHASIARLSLSSARSRASRQVVLAIAALTLGACGRNQDAHARVEQFVHAPRELPPPPPPLETEPARVEVAAPSAPAPAQAQWAPGSSAFRAPIDGSCPPPSELVDAMCVHASVFGTMSRDAVAALVADYRRGVRPPLVGGAPAAPAAPTPTAAAVPNVGVPIFVHPIEGVCPVGYVAFESDCAHSSVYRARGDTAMLRPGFRYFQQSGSSPRFIEGAAPAVALGAPPARSADRADAGAESDRSALANLEVSPGWTPTPRHMSQARRSQICAQYQSDFRRIDHMRDHGNAEERQMVAVNDRIPLMQSLRSEIERMCRR